MVSFCPSQRANFTKKRLNVHATLLQLLTIKHRKHQTRINLRGDYVMHQGCIDILDTGVATAKN